MMGAPKEDDEPDFGDDEDDDCFVVAAKEERVLAMMERGVDRSMIAAAMKAMTPSPNILMMTTR